MRFPSDRLLRPAPILAMVAIATFMVANIQRQRDLAGIAFMASVVLVIVAVVLDRRRQPKVTANFRDEVLLFIAAAARRGEPMGGALAAVAEEVGGRSRLAAQAALAALDAGHPLSDALSVQPAPFLSPDETAILRAVESAGPIADLLGSARFRRRERRRTTLLVTLPLAYGVVLFFLGAGSVAVVLDQFAYIQDIAIEGSLHPTVEPSAVLFWLVGSNAWAVAFQVLLVTILVGWFVSSSRRRPGLRRRMVQGVLLRIPGFGSLLRLEATAHVCRALAVLVGAERPLDQSLSRVAPAAGVESIANGLEEAAIAVAHGEPPAPALREAGLPPFAVARIAAATAVGRSDSFSRALLALAVECEERASQRRAALRAVVYPAILVTASVLAFLTYLGFFEAHANLIRVSGPW